MVRLFPKKFIYLSIFLLAFSPLINIFLSNNLINTTEYYRSENPRISNGYLDIDISILPDIDYTKLNDSWYNPKIENSWRRRI